MRSVLPRVGISFSSWRIWAAPSRRSTTFWSPKFQRPPFPVMTKTRIRQEPTSPRRPRTRLLTPPGSVAREYETALRRDFGIELSEFSDHELRAVAASHGLRQVL